MTPLRLKLNRALLLLKKFKTLIKKVRICLLFGLFEPKFSSVQIKSAFLHLYFHDDFPICMIEISYICMFLFIPFETVSSYQIFEIVTPILHIPSLEPVPVLIKRRHGPRRRIFQQNINSRQKFH